MRPWLPRALWLCAWSFWAWLGWGLYLELPRDLGPAIAHIQLNARETPLGFFPAADALVTLRHVSSPDQTVINVWEANNGHLRAQSPGPRVEERKDEKGAVLVQTVVVSREWDPSAQDFRLWTLDAQTGRKIPTDDFGLANAAFHPGKPIGVFFTYAVDEASARGSVRAIDLSSGRPLLRWTLGKADGKLLAGTPFFFGGDRIAIPAEGAQTPHEQWLELWNVSGEARLERTIKGIPIGTVGSVVAVAGERVAWVAPEQWDLIIRVANLETGRLIFEDPTERHQPTFPVTMGLNYQGPKISRDGRVVLDRQRGVLWDVDSGRKLWEGRWGWEPQTSPTVPIATLLRTQVLASETDEIFDVEEAWYLAAFQRSTSQTTYTSRKLSDGSLLYRCWSATSRPGRVARNATLLLDEDGGIHRLPPPANWPLLILSQTILALPLLLTWLALRWRRKRRLRTAGAAT